MAQSPHVLRLDEVAELLRVSPDRLRRIRPRLERAGFPQRLPACGARWSAAAVLDWIVTAGGTAPAGVSLRPAGAGPDQPERDDPIGQAQARLAKELGIAS